MCGIFGIASTKSIKNKLYQGLIKLEYRGYDSSGISGYDVSSKLTTIKATGPIKNLRTKLPILTKITTGIAHTRWATHGEPILKNTHPHLSENISVVHNGIIENHVELRSLLKKKNYTFKSDTDSEAISHLIHMNFKKSKNMETAIISTSKMLKGSYAIGCMNTNYPNTIFAACNGSPLIIGKGKGENFIASDITPILADTKDFITLNDNEFAKITPTEILIFNSNKKKINKATKTSKFNSEQSSLSGHKHFMHKEIYEQKSILKEMTDHYVGTNKILPNIFGPGTDKMFENIDHIHFVACGTSYHASLVAKDWIEEYTTITCTAEVASEYKYKKINVLPKTLFVSISQSGETADTISSVKKALKLKYSNTLAICNVAESTITRLSKLVFLMNAGPEISVASTKAFTSQLFTLLLLTVVISRKFGNIENNMVKDIRKISLIMDNIYQLETDIKKISSKFKNKEHTLFLGKGSSYPIALEAALKLKEISYIHASAYHSGELKHGPLALVDKKMPVVCFLPDNHLAKLVLSNLAEVEARQGQTFIFTNKKIPKKNKKVEIIKMPDCPDLIAPILYIIPAQLLSYHVALKKKTDVDKPRNLAKSVTVE
ncbi:glutamine--fructose-6-phosphate transaminase (isomerizing) [Gammaproteobacteria bacterium]|nr:glutamine--fructose-6-phosphate transaminase (isomerizing) [Gammaproteobacteria bacterium]